MVFLLFLLFYLHTQSTKVIKNRQNTDAHKYFVPLHYKIKKMETTDNITQNPHPTNLVDIRTLALPQLTEAMQAVGEKSFRAKQIYEWLWQKSARSFDEMTNLSKPLREMLQKNFVINGITTNHSQFSNDGTIKNRFELYDGFFVEGVLIPTDSRTTACVSSQVGCSLTCKFCATGKLKRERNLTAAEIYDQVAIIKKQSEQNFERNLSNIVYMGMGEPLLNYKNVMESIEKITSPQGLGMSAQRITLSTAGIAKMIKQLADDDVKFNLALSLHAANDDKRNQIMPINETNTLEALADALRYFYEKTRTRITYEYIVFNNFNDTLQDARELADFCKIVPCKVNLIEYNTIGDGAFENTAIDRLHDFAQYLDQRNIIVNIRRSRGKDIDAACGQLANKGESTVE
jgi:23S rRNA (adenine2503-C2)-methyltransferase